jgi:hypothetical protein
LRVRSVFYWREGFMRYAVEMASDGMISIPTFMKVGSGIEVILINLNTLWVSSVGFTDERDLGYMPMRWPQAHYIHTKFHDHPFRNSSNIKVITSTIWEAVMLVLFRGGIYEVCLKMASYCMIWRLSFMRIGTGVQATLRFCLSSFRGCNVGTSDGKNWWSTPLRWSLVPWYTYKVSWRLVQTFK